MFRVPEKYRVKNGIFKSDSSYENNGQFIIKKVNPEILLFCQASDGAGWEHVSVSSPSRAPTWDEMCFIKDLFWDRDDLVVQFHPIESEYVNNHSYCLHLWRKSGSNDFCETPHSILVGIKI